MPIVAKRIDKYAAMFMKIPLMSVRPEVSVYMSLKLTGRSGSSTCRGALTCAWTLFSLCLVEKLHRWAQAKVVASAQLNVCVRSGGVRPLGPHCFASTVLLSTVLLEPAISRQHNLVMTSACRNHREAVLLRRHCDIEKEWVRGGKAVVYRLVEFGGFRHASR